MKKNIFAVSQQLDSLPGVNTTMDWDRRYPYGDTLRVYLVVYLHQVKVFLKIDRTIFS